MITSSAAVATAQASGLPPYVLPSAPSGVLSRCRRTLAGSDDVHDRARGQDGADRVEAAGQGLAEGDDVWLDRGVVLEGGAVRISSAHHQRSSAGRMAVTAQGEGHRPGDAQLAGAAQAGLDLVDDEQDVVLAAERLAPLEVVVRWDDLRRELE